MADRALEAAFLSAQKAVDKAEEAQGLRNIQQNDWQKRLDSNNLDFARKRETDAAIDAVGKRTEANTARIIEFAGTTTANTAALASLTETVTWITRLVIGVVVIALLAVVLNAGGLHVAAVP